MREHHANDLPGFRRTTVWLNGTAWLVAVADTPALRMRGLRWVSALTAVDGMLFIHDIPSLEPYQLADAFMPLEIAFFAMDGSLIDRFVMEAPKAGPHLAYRPSAPAKYALETTIGRLDGLGSPIRIVVPH